MMADNVVRGQRVLDNGRAPKAIEERRVCASKSCSTTLSRYNRKDFCYAHAPTKFPRLRGRVVPES
jgi:hypothetical protein